MKLEGGSVFVCSCGIDEFKMTHEEHPLHLFCRCGQVYTIKDLPPLWEQE